MVTAREILKIIPWKTNREPRQEIDQQINRREIIDMARVRTVSRDYSILLGVADKVQLGQ